MSDIQIILSPPSSTFRAFVPHARRLSIPTIIKPAKIQSPKLLSSQSQRQPPLLPQRKYPLTYHLYTIFLFTFSDLKNILLPQTLLAVSTAIACPTRPMTKSDIFYRSPLCLTWIWLHLLMFNISNQRQPSSQAEDKQNKPWRPLPSGRLTIAEARRLQIVASIVAILFSVITGGLVPSLILMALFMLNNDLALGDSNPISRNILNAAGYTTFALGGISVLTSGLGSAISRQGFEWLAFLAGVILSTGQCQDLEDQDGDRAAGRKTIPLVLGDETARWSIIIPMALWTFAAPRFWVSGFKGSAMVFILAATVMKRLVVGDATQYKMTFRLWDCWLLALYALPLCSRIG